MLRLLWLSFILCFGFLSAAENKLLKITMNMPVFYHLRIDGDVKTDGKDPRINFKSFAMDVDFSVIVKNEQKFPEVVITPTKLEGSLKFNQGNAIFDFSKENLTFNQILVESFPILRAIKLNQPIRIPITDNQELLQNTNSDYPLLPINNPEAHANLSKKILDFFANGFLVKEGRSHMNIPELNLEFFSNEKIVEAQLKGEHTFRFFTTPKGTRNGCKETFTGGGKFSNSTSLNHVIHTKAQGIFLLLFRKMDCPTQELNERHEVRGKFLLTPKQQAISPLT